MKGGRRAGRNAPLAIDGVLQWGIRKDLWPKYFPKCPVARHFVCHRRSMSGAIAKALPTCIYRTLGLVGFALGWKLLLKFGAGFFSERSRRSGWAKRFCFGYNSETQFATMRP